MKKLTKAEIREQENKDARRSFINLITNYFLSNDNLNFSYQSMEIEEQAEFLTKAAKNLYILSISSYQNPVRVKTKKQLKNGQILEVINDFKLVARDCDKRGKVRLDIDYNLYAEIEEENAIINFKTYNNSFIEAFKFIFKCFSGYENEKIGGCNFGVLYYSNYMPVAYCGGNLSDFIKLAIKENIENDFKDISLICQAIASTMNGFKDKEVKEFIKTFLEAKQLSDVISQATTNQKSKSI